MRHLIAIVAVLSVVFASTAWAADRHEEALTGQHVSADQGSGDAPSELPESCDHCCHGSSHYVALRDGEAMVVAARGTAVQPATFHQPVSHSSTPPTPPPSS
jgi:hypothetical protein